MPQLTLHHVLVHHRHGVGVERAARGARSTTSNAGTAHGAALKHVLVHHSHGRGVEHVEARVHAGGRVEASATRAAGGSEALELGTSTAGLRLLDLNVAALELDARVSHGVVDARLFGKRRERKALGTPVQLVKHDGRVHDLAEAAEEVLERFGRHGRSEAADKDLGGALVLGARDGALGVDLGSE
jgi:hypothetical protein